MRRESMRTRLRTAIRSLIVDEYSLFVSWTRYSSAHEIAVASQLARHLAPMFSRTWDIDCEYNRAGTDQVKRGAGSKRHPADLVIHRRTGTGSANNLLVLELKVPRPPERDDRPDTVRARRGGTEESVKGLQMTHEYQHGVFLRLNCARPRGGGSPDLEPTWRWFSSKSDDTAFSLVFNEDERLSILEEARHNWEIRRRHC